MFDDLQRKLIWSICDFSLGLVGFPSCLCMFGCTWSYGRCTSKEASLNLEKIVKKEIKDQCKRIIGYGDRRDGNGENLNKCWYSGEKAENSEYNAKVNARSYHGDSSFGGKPSINSTSDTEDGGRCAQHKHDHHSISMSGEGCGVCGDSRDVQDAEILSDADGSNFDDADTRSQGEGNHSFDGECGEETIINAISDIQDGGRDAQHKFSISISNGRMWLWSYS